jgi:hypothetical protein
MGNTSSYNGHTYTRESNLNSTSLTLYHASTPANCESIVRRQHLDPGTEGSFGPGIYLALCPTDAMWKARPQTETWVEVRVRLGKPVRLYDTWSNFDKGLLWDLTETPLVNREARAIKSHWCSVLVKRE